MGVLIIFAVAYNMLLGQSGLLSFGHAIYFGLAGYATVHLINGIKKYLPDVNNINLQIIDNYNLNGDFIESQAFAFLAIRSFLNLPISFSSTTGCNGFTVGGKLVENF